MSQNEMSVVASHVACMTVPDASGLACIRVPDAGLGRRGIRPLLFFLSSPKGICGSLPGLYRPRSH